MKTVESSDTCRDMLRYVMRRDIVILCVVLTYMFGPHIYNFIESLNDIEINVTEVDVSEWYRGEERMLYQVKREISELRSDIRKGQAFGWRDVFKDLAR